MTTLAHALRKAGAAGLVVRTETPCCPYCKAQAELVTGKEIYPHRPDLFAKKFWRCLPCDAYVGCHDAGNGYGDGTRPLGILANAQLRLAKSNVHNVFDDIWKLGFMTRRKAYSWLAKEMGIRFDDCHIGMFNVEQCSQAIGACEQWWEDLKV